MRGYASNEVCRLAQGDCCGRQDKDRILAIRGEQPCGRPRLTNRAYRQEEVGVKNDKKGVYSQSAVHTFFVVREVKEFREFREIREFRDDSKVRVSIFL